eukprot:CAMPEP_0170551170 /NCGR_PEP_ID=MMETSP0211-20121228/9198_1 /TAXON_ID=311385 /ORGANISM="Pseudokeronopsis sp., Strain OXSARD2" /LENGTH=46 /DNA_ID= /DNA_START= /DNA_END= /DNA_ORIENTATION=
MLLFIQEEELLKDGRLLLGPGLLELVLQLELMHYLLHQVWSEDCCG